MNRRLPPRHEPSPLRDYVVVGALLVCAFWAVISLTSGCSESTLNKIDPPLPVNANTYRSCPNVPAPGCRKDDQECPLEGTVCIDKPPQTCEEPPCASDAPVFSRMRVDAGTADAGAR